MNYQKTELPKGAVNVGSTPRMTDETAAPGILKNHLTPKGKYGLLVVEEGALKFVWEDDVANVLDADPEHPIVIVPERFHHVVITGKVAFRVEFYEVPDSAERDSASENAERPGEAFLD